MEAAISEQPETHQQHARITQLKARALAIGAGVLAGLASPAAAQRPETTTPDRSWGGVKQILIVSHLVNDRVLIPDLTSESLCKRAAAIAAKGAPVPVTCATLGQPTPADSAVLLLHAAVSHAVPKSRVLIFTIRRADQAGLEPGATLLGSTPRAIVLAEPWDSAGFDGAVRLSLGELLPWLGISQN